jgi:opacity protein-like surface antigen
MTKYFLCGAAIAALLSAPSADAADVTSSWGPAVYNWSGFYAGAVAGAAWGQYDPRTATVSDGYLDAANAAAVTAAGTQSIKTNGFVTGIEGGYNWQTGQWLIGLEADLEAVHLLGQTSSGGIAYPDAVPPHKAPGDVFAVFSSAQNDWLLTARPRLGFVASNNWLFYATGGLAVTRLHTDTSFADDNPNHFAEETGKVETTKVGYAVGGGVEAPLTNRLSVKADYLHVGFGNTAGISTANNLLTAFPAQVFTHSSDLKADMVRVGLNYRFDAPDAPSPHASLLPLKAPPLLKAPPSSFDDWQVEVGARLWFSSGREQEGLLFSPPPTAFVSNLNYTGMNAISGETFARVDHTSGFFVKGNLGAGGFDQGHLNDEDFPAVNAYSNTLSNLSGHIDYATIDIGYNFFRTPNAKLGAFVGYNYYQQGINAYGCTQLAGDLGCLAPPSGTLGITEYDHFHALRLGLSSQVMLTDRLRLTADAAYLPWVSYQGLDTHDTALELFPDADNAGNGMMLEAALDYDVTANWSVGVGGRYWAWNMSNNGSSTFIDVTGATPSSSEPSGFTAARYGMFIQSSYRWGAPTPATSATALPTKAPVSASSAASGAMNWTGFYIGGHMGGGWGDDRWSDPFAATPGLNGFINVPGFGDITRATGPLGGGQIGANWQTGSWVLGVQADASAADIKGQNSCFTGLGGVLCGRLINALGTLTGRFGYAWDRSLAYVKGGGAWIDTTYSVFGNTDFLTLGSSSTTLNDWGWTVGAGAEYAITNHWTTFAEYDHIGAPSANPSFPTVTTINAARIAVKQSVDLFKVGVNYKFDFGS